MDAVWLAPGTPSGGNRHSFTLPAGGVEHGDREREKNNGKKKKH